MLIKNATVVTNDPKKPVIKNGHVGVDDGLIVDLGERTEGASASTVLDGEGRLVIPGLVNSHTHLCQSLARGIGDDLPLYSWLDRIWRFSKRMSSPETYIGTLLGAVEAIKTGTTCVVNHQNQPTDRSSVEKAVEAMSSVGLRGVFVRGSPRVLTKASERMKILAGHLKPPEEAFTDLKVTEKLMDEHNDAHGGLVKVWPGFPSMLTTDPEYVLKAHEVAKRRKVGIHTHCSEGRLEPTLYKKGFGVRPVEDLYRMGVLSPMFHLAHGNWLSRNEIDMLGRTKGCVVHNPVSNMYLGSGLAPVPELHKAGATVALGSDGPASNNNLDMVSTMKTAALLHKAVNLNPSIITAPQVFRMATLEGCKILGFEEKIGAVKEGMLADLALINVKKPHIQPIYDGVSAMVYCCQGGDVETVVIDGKIVMENRVLKNVDEEEIIAKAQKIAEILADRAGLSHN